MVSVIPRQAVNSWLIFLLISVFLPFISCGLIDSNASDDDTDIQNDTPGEIVFSAKDALGRAQIYTINIDGSGLKQLTFLKGGAYYPSWSPDGKQIVFSSWEYGTSTGPALWVMNADGSNQRVLYDPEPDNIHLPPIAGNHPRWSPDGTKIAYDLCLNCQIATNYDIYIFNTVTKEITRLTNHPANDTYPTWSPDGRQIAFESKRDYWDADTLRFRHDLYIINLDGLNITRLTEIGHASYPTWSPDGDTIIFKSTVPKYGIYKISISSREYFLVKEDSTEKTYMSPRALSYDGLQLLITAVSFEEPKSNSVHILDLRSNRLKKIYSQLKKNANPVIFGADLFVRTER